MAFWNIYQHVSDTGVIVPYTLFEEEEEEKQEFGKEREETMEEEEEEKEFEEEREETVETEGRTK